MSLLTRLISLTSLCSTLLCLTCEAASTVWGTPVSPYVRKVLVVLEEKHQPYTLKETLPTKLLEATHQAVPEDFKKASPLGKIPAYQDEKVTLADSAVIAAYLEKRFPEHPLYPSEPNLYGQALWFEKYADTVMSDVIYQKIFVEKVIKPVVLKQSPDMNIVNKAVAEEMPAILDYLEKSLNHKEWLVSDRLTIADIAVANHLVSLKMAGVEIDAKRWPSVVQYRQKMLALPSFQKVVPKL